ncbi:acidic leucine-rich nuclear phosphoprotein 32 family member A isoform X2 [Solenopsis invicta]|uniref:acidic leucine-rich nuclear phosphoprotein 32 family member A isoform X2 n=1 Tax=Solenopsis invicta TaxID=13686 RepID=UPI00193E881D|nr:acidic leucine-rich nuclear phosphoprotein 32 family member A isoform X2 [Solenopsis invicta]
MVKLTEEMVVARTRVSDFSAVKKLNCWGTELTDVSILRKMQNVEVLSLSINNINTLADFQYCHKLQDLFIRRNNIKDLNEVCYLQGLPNLRNLWLGENPCAESSGYRLAVLRVLPNLEKLDDKIVSPEEVQSAMTFGRPLIHPLEVDASPQSDVVSPERSFDETQHIHEEYDPDRRNANYNASSSHHYSQNNQYAYELQNGQSKNQSKDDTMCAESRSNSETVATNTLEISKDYDERPVVQRHNGDYDERRAYSEYGGNEVPQRVYASTPQRTQYAVNEFADDKRNDRNNYSYDERTRLEYEDSPQPPSTPQTRRMIAPNEREDMNQGPGWIRHSEKNKCKSQFHYHRRPVTRNSNILSAVLCLVKELDYPSLEVVEMAVRNRMDELEE